MGTIDLNTYRQLQESAGSDFVAELTRTFLEEAPRMIEELIAAMAANDAEKFRRMAHSLKSNANTFGATRLGQLARELETTGLEAVIQGDAAAVATMAEEYQRVAAELTGLLDA